MAEIGAVTLPVRIEPTVEGRRVVLVKPGDVLLIGNAGPISAGAAEAITGRLHALLGIPTIVFDGDIDLDMVRRHELGEPEPVDDGSGA